MKDPTTGLNFKKSNIRIWIHQRNLTNLQQVVWEGHGSKLLVEHSNNPKIKKFFDAVPHIMGLIKDIHTDVINDEIENLKKRVSAPVPPLVLSGKDANGLTPLHKAAGLGKHELVEFIVSEYPTCVNTTDNEGRTPLHYASLVKDDGKMTKFLLENGADESALDNKQKTAAYYKNRNSELDTKSLSVIPDCPRTAKESFLSNFDWTLLTAATPIEEIHKGFKKIENGNGKENGEEKETPSEEKPPENITEEDHKDEGETETELDKANGETEPTNNEQENNENVDETKETEDDNKNTEESSETVENNDANDAAEQNEDPSENIETNEQEPPAENNESNNTEEKVDEDPNEPQPDPSEETKEETIAVENEDNNRPTSSTSEKNSRPATAKEEGENNDTNERPPAESEKPPVENEEPPVEPEGIIEGIVNGENEVETLNEEGQDAAETDDNSEDPDIVALVEAGNMEQLATLVLNGEGEKLIGQTSDNPELQSFLDNVQVYMTKINRIHVAAREGSLRDLQAALDRRKFAIAKDKISPNGASPLHTAVTFGNTSIVRYLAGRFPETAQVTDDDGRTPLHYAAVLPDNGHYYNLLIHLGADSRNEDKFGHSPEYYRTHQDEFSHKSLLRDFGAEESVSDEMLSDKVPNDTYSARKDLDDEDMLNVLERCYNVLHGRRASNVVSAASNSSSTTQTSYSSSVISKHTKRVIFDTIKTRVTKLDHNLYDVIWPSVKKLPAEMSLRVALDQDFPAGIVAPDFYVYKVFGEYMEPIIKDYNSIDTHFDLAIHPPSKFTDQQQEKMIEIEFDLDPQCRWIISGTLDCTRNLNNFELPKSLNVSQLEKVERLVTTVLLSNDVARALYPNASVDDLAEGSGVYYTMNEVLEDPSEARVVLASHGLLIPLWNIPESDRLHGKHWPYGRGVFVSNGNNLAVWINVLDHIRIVTCTPHTKPGNVVPSNGNNQVDMPFFATEEGRYLASSLGDPLIKGLTEVANKRPEDPIAYLATYLYNFANNRQNIHSRGKTQENQQTITGPPQEADNNNAVPASIEVVTVDPEDSGSEEDSAFNSTSRDEHGQSMLHFAAARAHGRNALFQLLVETEINVAYRDELYRTARDISIQANIPENTQEIDRYVMSIATKGDTDKLVELLLDGYDHITDIIDENDVPIIEAVTQHNQPDTVSFLQSILAFEEKRERVHHAIRLGSINDVTSLLADENETGSGKLLAIGKNSYGRCSLHIAVLCQQEEIVDYLANTFPETLKLGDNLERTALHYAMGVEKMETISRVLIKAGSKRIIKDLKGRQPTYYFLNKSDILRLQEEEETF